MSNPPAGYYDDPARPGTHRWWDGTEWAALDAPGATLATLTAVQPTVSIPAGYYEHPHHPGSVTWWNGSAWADVAVVPDASDLEIVDREDVTAVATADGLSPAADAWAAAAGSAAGPGVYADPDDVDHLRWWDGRAWERAAVHAESPVLTVDGRDEAESRLHGSAPLADVSRTEAASARRAQSSRHGRRLRRVLVLVVGLLAVVGAVVAYVVTR